MDDYRKMILRLFAAHPETDLKKASLAIDRNHAYLQQFIKRGTPRYLKEIDRLKLAIHLGIPESALMPPEQKKLELMRHKYPEEDVIKKYRELSEPDKKEFVGFLDYLHSKKPK